MRSISGAMGGYRESLSDVMSEIGMKFCKLSEPYSNTYDKKLLHIILYGAEHHKSFKDLYYVVDYRTGKREFNRAKQKGMLDILYRAQTGEYADHIKHYFGDSPYSNSYADSILSSAAERIRKDMEPKQGFFARMKNAVSSFFAPRQYALSRA